MLKNIYLRKNKRIWMFCFQFWKIDTKNQNKTLFYHYQLKYQIHLKTVLQVKISLYLQESINQNKASTVTEKTQSTKTRSLSIFWVVKTKTVLKTSKLKWKFSFLSSTTLLRTPLGISFQLKTKQFVI